MNQQQLVQDRIRKVVAIVIVVFLLFGLRLIDIQAIRAKGFVDRANNELSKSATLDAYHGDVVDTIIALACGAGAAADERTTSFKRT